MCLMFENKVLKTVFGPTREEVTEGWGKLQYYYYCYYYYYYYYYYCYLF
jgi:hypothetical protein